jgi:hypothetical protein
MIPQDGRPCDAAENSKARVHSEHRVDDFGRITCSDVVGIDARPMDLHRWRTYATIAHLVWRRGRGYSGRSVPDSYLVLAIERKLAHSTLDEC